MCQATACNSRAIVSWDRLSNGGWKMEDVEVRKPGSGELLVEMVASGICHTDALIGDLPSDMSPVAFYPRVLGHEGTCRWCLPKSFQAQRMLMSWQAAPMSEKSVLTLRLPNPTILSCSRMPFAMTVRFALRDTTPTAYVSMILTSRAKMAFSPPILKDQANLYLSLAVSSANHRSHRCLW